MALFGQAAVPEGRVCVWDTATGQATFVFKSSTSVNAVAFSPDGTKIVAGGGNLDLVKPGSWLKEWDAVSGRENWHHWNQGTGGAQLQMGVGCLAFSPDGKKIISGGGKTVDVRDAANGQILMKFKGFEGYVTSLAFSPDGRKIVGSDGTTVRVWGVQAKAADPPAPKRRRHPTRERNDHQSVPGQNVATARHPRP